MYIKKIALKDFRGFSRLELSGISKKFNVFIGKNAQGKTNLIESINYLSCGKSFRRIPSMPTMLMLCFSGSVSNKRPVNIGLSSPV